MSKLVVSSEKGLAQVAKFVAEHRCDTFSFGSERCVSIGRGSGRRYRRRGRIVVADSSLFERVCDEIRKGLVEVSDE